MYTIQTVVYMRPVTIFEISIKAYKSIKLYCLKPVLEHVLRRNRTSLLTKRS